MKLILVFPSSLSFRYGSRAPRAEHSAPRRRFTQNPSVRRTRHAPQASRRTTLGASALYCPRHPQRACGI
eukprot:3461659-Pleurochrysis_carterae.AAC.1